MPKWCKGGSRSVGRVYLGADPPPDLYLGLYKNASEPSASDDLTAITEAQTPGAYGYDRILLEPADWVQSPGGLWTNVAKAFIASGGDWGQITGFFVADDPSGTSGRLIAVKHFPGGPYQISNGNTLAFTPIVTNQTSYSLVPPLAHAYNGTLPVTMRLESAYLGHRVYSYAGGLTIILVPGQFSYDGSLPLILNPSVGTGVLAWTGIPYVPPPPPPKHRPHRHGRLAGEKLKVYGDFKMGDD